MVAPLSLGTPSQSLWPSMASAGIAVEAKADIACDEQSQAAFEKATAATRGGKHRQLVYNLREGMARSERHP